MNLGFSVRGGARGVEFSFYAASSADSQPLTCFARTPHGCAAMIGRVHYRDELSSALAYDRSAERPASDAALALAAYEKWGSAGLQRLEGDYALVMWDARTNCLLAARDPLGGFPLFWEKRNGSFAVSTAMEPLLRARSPTLNLDFLAEYLSLPSLAIQELPIEACAYAGVRRVMPGCVLGMDVTSGSVRVQSSWDWLERIADPGTDRMEEIAEQFSRLIREAVRERMGRRTAAHFSGGMDSTAVALVARDWLRSRTGEAPLHALSLIYDRLASLKRETAFIDAALAQQRDMTVHRIAADGLLAYDGLADEPVPDEPFPGLFDRAKDHAMISKAATLGVDTILTGQGGDSVFDILPFHMADMLGAGRLRSAWREARAWGSAMNQDSWRILRDLALTPMLPISLQGGVRSMLRHGMVGWRHQKQGTVAPWILPEFARSQGLYERSLAHLRRLYRTCRPLGLSAAVASARGLAGDGLRWALAAPRGIMVAHPYIDSRILSLGLGTRLRYRPEPGKHKPLLAHAMRDVLPETIRTRLGKNNFNEVYYRGLRRNLPVLESLIRQPWVSDLGFIDRDELSACLRRVALAGDQSAAGAMRLDSTLSLLTWVSLRRGRQVPASAPASTFLVTVGVPARELEAVPC